MLTNVTTYEPRHSARVHLIRLDSPMTACGLPRAYAISRCTLALGNVTCQECLAQAETSDTP